MAAANDPHKAQMLADLEKEHAPLNEQEKKTLAVIESELKEWIKPTTPRSTIIRFIRGYAGEADPTRAAVDRLKECLIWRQSEGIQADTILERKFNNDELFRKAWPVGIHGHDKAGRPVYVERVGKLDPDLVSSTFTIDELIRFHVQMMERLNAYKEQKSQQLGKLMYKHIVIIDLEGFGTRHLGGNATTPLKSMVHIDQHFYPESLYKMIICNAPFVFRMGWAIVKPMLHPLTRERIKMGNEYLKDVMDEDQIPQFLGGKCKCANGQCLMVPFEEH